MNKICCFKCGRELEFDPESKVGEIKNCPYCGSKDIGFEGKEGNEAGYPMTDGEAIKLLRRLSIDLKYWKDDRRDMAIERGVKALEEKLEREVR
ncbi:hypothetical protein ES703_14602 [subsurface metagenome]